MFECSSITQYLKFLFTSGTNSEAPMPCAGQLMELHMIGKCRPHRVKRIKVRFSFIDVYIL